MKRIRTASLDMVGLYTAATCAVHCSLIPVMAFLGVFTSLNWTHNFLFEISFLLISAMIAVVAMVRGYYFAHKNPAPVFVGILGFAMFSAGLLLSYPLEIMLTTLGAICIASSHFINWRLIKKLQ